MWHTYWYFLFNVHKKLICLQKKFKSYSHYSYFKHSAWIVTKGSRKTMSHYEFHCAKISKKNYSKLVTFSWNYHVGTWSLILRPCSLLMKEVACVVTRWLPLSIRKRCLCLRIQRHDSNKPAFVGSGRSQCKRKNGILGILLS